MSVKQFLQVGGAILLVLGIVGYLVPNIGGQYLWFDNAENVAHTLLGVVALGLSTVPNDDLQKWVVVLVGIVALYFGVWGFVVAGNPTPNYYGVTNLETLDNIVHLVVGVWALWASLGNKPAMASF
jgi:hypothetical protein